jgi:hypothetical protein
MAKTAPLSRTFSDYVQRSGMGIPLVDLRFILEGMQIPVESFHQRPFELGLKDKDILYCVVRLGGRPNAQLSRFHAAVEKYQEERRNRRT